MLQGVPASLLRASRALPIPLPLDLLTQTESLVEIPAAAAEYLCCQCPLDLSGQVLEARALADRINQ